MLAAHLLERGVATDLGALTQSRELDAREPGRTELRFERLRRRKASPVDALQRRKELVEPVAVEVRRIERRDHEPSVVHQRA